MKRFCIFAFIMFCVSSCIVNANSLVNVSINNELHTFSDDIYDFIARLLAKGHVDEFPKNSYPYSRGEIAKILFDLSLKVDKGEIKLSKIEKNQLEIMKALFFDALENKVTAKPDKIKSHIIDIKGDEYRLSVGGGISEKMISRSGAGFLFKGRDYITSLRPSFSGQVRDSFAFSSDIKSDYHIGDVFYDLISEKPKLIYETINTENVLSTQAYSIFKLPWFKLLLGKDDMQWGPGYHGQLMLSSNPKAMNMIKLDARYGKIKFQSFTAKLLSDLGNKYMSAHRLEFIIGKKLDIGISETLIYGNNFEIDYLNPVQIYFISQLSAETNSGKSNTLESVDFSYRITNGFQVYGELAIDEAGLFDRPINHWNTKFGALTGIYITDPLSISDTDFRMEYAFTNQYFYTYSVPLNTYTQVDTNIGHWMGTDADDLWCEVKHRFTDRIDSALSYELERHGEGRVDKPHLNSMPYNEKWKFLSGVTQYKHSISLSTSYSKIGYHLFKAKYTHSYLANIDNKRGKNGSGNQVTLEACYWF
jgi:hypothetical protein